MTNTAPWEVGLLAAVIVVAAYWMAADRAGTARTGCVLPRPPLPDWARSLGGRRIGFVVDAVPIVVFVAGMTGLTVGPEYAPLTMVLCLGVPAAYTDARELRLPDELIYTLAAGVAITVIALDVARFEGSAVRALLCGLAYSVLLLAVALFAPTGRAPTGSGTGSVTATPTAMGLGDIKLAVGLGTALGWVSLTAPVTALLLTALGHLMWSVLNALTRYAGLGQGMVATALGPWMVSGAVMAFVASQSR